MDATADGATALGERTIEIGAGAVRVREAGSGVPLLFVHGWGANGDLWSDAAGALARSHRVIVPDLPWGSQRIPLRADADLSPLGAARIVADLIAALDLDAVTVVANDAGGAISQLVVTHYPERIERLVLTNCDALEQFPPDAFKPLVRSLRIPGVSAVLHRLLGIRAVQRSPLAYGRLARDPVPDALLDSFREPSVRDRDVRRDSTKFARGIDPSYTLDAAAKLASVRIPVLLVWGDADPFFPLELGRRLEALFPNARLVAVPGAYCFVPLDAPRQLAEEVAAFVAETSSARQVS